MTPSAIPVRTGKYEGKNTAADDARFDWNERDLPKVTGSLSGEKELPKKGASPEDIRSLERQDEAAVILSERGLTVERLPHRNGKNGPDPDLKINGETADVYSPTSTNLDTIAGNIFKKTNPAKQQAPNVVVNLADTPLTPSEVAQFIQRNPIAGLKSLTLIKDGKVIVLSGGK